MKHQDLIRHLEANGCVLVREGAKHSVYYNSAAQRTSTVPRHREVKNPRRFAFANNLMCLIHFVEIFQLYIISSRPTPRTNGGIKITEKNRSYSGAKGQSLNASFPQTPRGH